jgi:hypothetical protein
MLIIIENCFNNNVRYHNASYSTILYDNLYSLCYYYVGIGIYTTRHTSFLLFLWPSWNSTAGNNNNNVSCVYNISVWLYLYHTLHTSRLSLGAYRIISNYVESLHYWLYISISYMCRHLYLQMQFIVLFFLFYSLIWHLKRNCNPTADVNKLN